MHLCIAVDNHGHFGVLLCEEGAEAGLGVEAWLGLCGARWPFAGGVGGVGGDRGRGRGGGVGTPRRGSRQVWGRDVGGCAGSDVACWGYAAGCGARGGGRGGGAGGGGARGWDFCFETDCCAEGERGELGNESGRGGEGRRG